MTPPTDTAAAIWSAIDAYGCDAAWHGALGRDATTREALDRAITAHVEAEVARRLAPNLELWRWKCHDETIEQAIERLVRERNEYAEKLCERNAALVMAPDVEVAIVDYAHAVQSDFDAHDERNALRAAIAADKAALDATWRAHDLERDAEVAQAQAATHEACAALQAICAALHVTPPTGSTYCTEAVTMVVERVAADKARAVEGMRPVLSQADAERLVGDFNASPYDGSNDCPARAALLAALTGAGEIRRQMDAAAVEMCADRAALTGAGGGR